MTIIRQTSKELYDMEPTQKYDAIISSIDMVAIYYEVSKKSRLGHYRIELCRDDYFCFHSVNCGILVSDDIPSEAYYSRHLTKLSESNILEEVQEKVPSSHCRRLYY